MKTSYFGGHITVTERGNDFHACLTANPARWESGKTAVEAVGKLTMDEETFVQLSKTIRDTPAADKGFQYA